MELSYDEVVVRGVYGEGRDRLISATIEVVAERGLRGLTFRSVSERAGVSNTLVARHFGTREALLAAATDWAVERSIKSTGLLELGAGDEFADSLLDFIAETPELQAFQYEMILEARRNPTFRAPVERLYARYQEVFISSLQGAGVTDRSGAVARRTFASLDGIVLQYLAGVEVGALREALHDVWESLQIYTPNHR